MSKKLKDLFGALQSEMISKMAFEKVVEHPVDKGDCSEINWCKWFSNYFPKRYAFAKATVIDCEGNVSDQIDIVVYDKQYTYLAFNENDTLYVPAESVYAVFEIKQDMTKNHIEYAQNKAESVRKLKRTSAPVQYSTGQKEPKSLKPILAGILTSTSGWSPSFGEPFLNVMKAATEPQRLDCGCALDAGSFICDYTNNTIQYGDKEESLVSFFLGFLRQLQALGTVPAIDFQEYQKSLSLSIGKIN